MHIDEIRRRSLEYAQGHVRTGPAFRTPKRKRKRDWTYAEWFGLSLEGKTKRPPPSHREPRPTRPDSQPSDQSHRYVPNPADALRDPSLMPWD